MSVASNVDERYVELMKKTKELEELREKLQRCYCLIKDTLKHSDIELILDDFIENRIFQLTLIRDIREEKKLHVKSTMLLESLLQSDKSVVMHFLELIKHIVPDVYEYMTGKQGLVIRRPLNNLRETIKRIEKFHHDKKKINKERFEELKNGLEVVEKEIAIWNNFLNTFSTTSIQIDDPQAAGAECENCQRLMDENKVLQTELRDIVTFMDGCSLDKPENANEETEEKSFYYNIRPVKIGTRRYKLVKCFQSKCDDASSLNQDIAKS